MQQQYLIDDLAYILSPDWEPSFESLYELDLFYPEPEVQTASPVRTYKLNEVETNVA